VKITPIFMNRPYLFKAQKDFEKHEKVLPASWLMKKIGKVTKFGFGMW
jgi:hypothetical protein